MLHPEYVSLGCSDGFSLGVSSVALQFVTPVLNKLDSAPSEMLPKLMPAETLPAMSRRLGNLMHARRLAAADESAAEVAEGDADGEGELGQAPTPNTQSAAAAGFMCAADQPGAAAGAAHVGTSAAGTTGASETPKPLEAPGFAVECVYLAIRGLQVSLHAWLLYCSRTMRCVGFDAGAYWI